jgi:hypothetical protein
MSYLGSRSEVYRTRWHHLGYKGGSIGDTVAWARLAVMAKRSSQDLTG